jgi:hypothetical protein
MKGGHIVLAASFGAINLMAMSFYKQAASEPVTFGMVEQRVVDQIILTRPSYDYAPSVIYDGSVYRLYWCAGVAGDFILHAQSKDLGGPWHSSISSQPNSFDVALRPTGSPANFDGLHTCDPNVIKVHDIYYMYYGGSSADGALTAIGVALSKDGVHFSRLNAGKAIVMPARTNTAYQASSLTYGAGQPAILYRDPFFYLSFTDSTGSGANPGNGAGQFLLRSTDPIFQSGVQERTRTGWVDRLSSEHSAEFSYLESFGIDWMFDTQTGLIIVASNRLRSRTTLYLIDPDSFTQVTASELSMRWHEGPALIAAADKTALPRSKCDFLQIGVISAEGPSEDPWTWDLALSVGDFKVSPCTNATK